MKKMLSLMLVALVASMSSAIYAGTPINQSELPKDALTFITKYFPNDKVRKAEKDNGRRGLEYEVDLTSGAEIDFMSDGKWKEVKAARGTAVPAGIVPSDIVKYVNTNFKGQTIVEISRKRGGYEVELSNGSELKLTEDAKPLPERQGNRQGGNRQGGNRPRR